MLYIENWQSGKKGGYTLILVMLVLLLMTGCSSWDAGGNKQITVEAFSDMRTPAFVFALDDIRSQLQAQVKADADNTEADRQTRGYYRNAANGLIWVNRMGVDERADTLLSWLQRVGESGFSERSFMVNAIESDLNRLRALDFAGVNQDINHIAGRLEYNLTKACLRYCLGQRFGFANPFQLFNSLDIEKQDTLRKATKYRMLYDVAMDLPSKNYAHDVLRKVLQDSLAAYLHEIQPSGHYYLQLKEMLSGASTSELRRRILVNMERARWRCRQSIPDGGKRIIVNIPAYHLYAYDGVSVLDMRVVCGTQKTKTPQLRSYVEWMEVNPQWIIPMSIIEHDVAHHAGDSAYFARNRYNIYERSTNKQMAVHAVSRQMLLSGNYRVAQEGGKGNSLGRIVFRFKNSHSVFLHDTSNPGAFNRQSRAVSHGCVRVSKPFELAIFMLDNPDEWLLDRIRISMGLSPETEQGIDYIANHHEEDHKLISFVPIKPRVPLYIIYNTLWPDADGVLQTWPDVYGYDDVIWKHLQPYL